jgi:UDP-N-acetyl-D-mannosaminuronic acid dehydrogenase
MIEKVSGKTAGKDFLISFCPERIAPGNALQEFTNNSRIIGANDEASYYASLTLFKYITSGALLKANTTEAEIAKLAENTFRDINIALANELAIICGQSGVDVIEVIRLANTHPRVTIHQPGPGVGGPCLPKDPYLLIAKNQIKSSLVSTARSLNDRMPEYVVNITIKQIESAGRTKRLSIGVLGLSYKPNVNDTRYAPAGGIIQALKDRGYNNISVHDPYSSDSFGARYNPDLLNILRDSDCIIIATAHTLYSNLKSQQFKKGAIIMDSVRVLRKSDFQTKEVTYLALGA